MVDGAVMLLVTRPGPATVVVPVLAVAVRTVAAPSMQVIVAPTCEQVVDCAAAELGNRTTAMTVDALPSKTRRIELVIMEILPLLLALETARNCPSDDRPV